MSKQVEKWEAVHPVSGKKVTVALLDNGGVRVRINKQRSAVTHHFAATGDSMHNSVTIIEPIEAESP